MDGQHLSTSSATPTSAATTALLIFTQSPRAEAKRLGLGPVRSAGLLSRLQRHTFREVQRCRPGYARFIATDDPETVAIEAQGLGARVFSQHGTTFESRLLGALARLAALGYRRAVVIGTDTPGLCAADLERALGLVSRGGTLEREAVVGPARDGGFYLLGFSLDQLPQLQGLPWKRSDLLRTLVRRLGAVSRVRFLPRRADVDSASDVGVLQSRLHSLTRGRDGGSLVRSSLNEGVLVQAILPRNPRASRLQGPHRAPPAFPFL